MAIPKPEGKAGGNPTTIHPQGPGLEGFNPSTTGTIYPFQNYEELGSNLDSWEEKYSEVMDNLKKSIPKKDFEKVQGLIEGTQYEDGRKADLGLRDFVSTGVSPPQPIESNKPKTRFGRFGGLMTTLTGIAAATALWFGIYQNNQRHDSEKQVIELRQELENSKSQKKAPTENLEAKARSEQISKDLAKKAEENKALQEKYETLHSQYTDLETAKKTLDDTYRNAQDELEEAKKNYGKQSEEVTRLTGVLQIVEKARDDYQGRLEEKIKEIGSLEKTAEPITRLDENSQLYIKAESNSLYKANESTEKAFNEYEKNIKPYLTSEQPEKNLE